MNCIVCEKSSGSAWTDLHGVASCLSCGAPYRLLHYEGEGAAQKRVEKEPECLVLPEWIPFLRRFNQETGRRAPHGFDFTGGDPSYSGITRADCNAWNDWCDKHREELPKQKEEPNEESA